MVGVSSEDNRFVKVEAINITQLQVEVSNHDTEEMVSPVIKLIYA